VSTLAGQSMANEKDTLYFAFVGDLAFFYDMNILGNRHVGNNVRILLVNNGLGAEFRISPWLDEKMGADKINEYISAAGHFGSAKGWAESMGFEYISAKTTGEFDGRIDGFCSENDRPVLFEVFTKPEDEIEALKILRRNNGGKNPYPHAMYQGAGSMGWSPEQDAAPKKKFPLFGRRGK
jgi:2-succinyl-5-enolpyruvyl-6-hydroxy-3-cyclohexene-1-carboxylate synthase